MAITEADRAHPQQLTPPSLTTERPIQLRVVNQHAYVWDIEGKPATGIGYSSQCMLTTCAAHI